MDLNFLIDPTFRMVLSNLFHSPTQKGKKRMLKLSFLQENSGKLFLLADLVWLLEVGLKFHVLSETSRRQFYLTIL